jgi:hypothetical protein
MARVPFNPKIGRIKTDAAAACDRAFLAHFNIPAADATAESDTAVMALTALGAEAASVTTGLTSPAAARNVKIDCNKSGITDNVTVYGLNMAGDEIDETKALNGLTAVALDLAFWAITKVDLPARTNTPVKQIATVAVTQGAQAAGSTVFTFLSAQTGDAFDITVPFALADDTTAEAATVLRAALNANATFAAKWTAGGSSANITITSKAYAAQDATINLTVKTAGDSDVTLGSITVDTASGVEEDKVSVGLGKKFGIPYLLEADEQVIVKLFDKSADTGTVTADADELEKNVIALTGTPDGLKDIDLYIIV